MNAPMESEEKARVILNTIEDRKAVDPVLLDLRGKTMMSDFFLVCTGTSNIHIRSIADGVLEKVDELDLSKPRIEGRANAEWVLLDFGDVVLHVMAEEQRERYRLEDFWSRSHAEGERPPSPESVGADDSEIDAEDLDDEDTADAKFFDDADQPVPPIDEDDLDEEDEEDEEDKLDEALEEDVDDDEDLDEDDDDDDELVNPSEGPRRIQ